MKIEPLYLFVIAGLIIFAVFFKDFKYGKLILKVIAGLAIAWVISTLLYEIVDTIRWMFWHF